MLVSNCKSVHFFSRKILLVMVAVVFIMACREDKEEAILSPANTPRSDRLVLHFYQNDTETRTEFETGMQWCFSYLGAQLEKGSWARGTKWLENEKIQIDFNELGFNSNAIHQLNLLINQYKNSEEYQQTGGIDAGRFLASIFNNSNHYYKIVGMPDNLVDFQSTYRYQPKKAAIVESAVAFGERLISLPQSTDDISSIAYLAEELTGSLLNSTHQIKENEVMDIMPNGQLRFGIYNKNWERVGGADSVLSSAGKPAKCLWCHEINIQKAIAATTSIPSYYSPQEFDSIIALNTMTLNSYRVALNPEIDFSENSQHTELEKLYIRYFEPSAKRLAAEWDMTENDVEVNLSAYTTHQHDEFPQMGELYYRYEVEQFSPYQVLPSASNARETEENEPNLLP